MNIGAFLCPYFYYCWLKHDLDASYSIEAQHNKTNKMTCGPSEDLDQPGHPPSLISLCCPKKFGFLATHKAHSKDGLDCVDVKADRSLCGRTSFCLFCRAPAHLSYVPLFPFNDQITVKLLENSDTRKFCCNHSKHGTRLFYHRVMCPEDVNGMANSVNPDQTTPLGAVYTVC